MDIAKKKMKRLDLLHRSIDSSYEKLNAVLLTNDDVESFLALKALLDLIFSADEMHFSTKYFLRRDNDEKGKYLNGLRYAANLLKHEKICFTIHDIYIDPKFSFPLEIPEEGIIFGDIQATWIKVDALPNPKLDNNVNFIEQKRVYNEFFVGNELFLAINAGIEFLLKEKEKFCS